MSGEKLWVRVDATRLDPRWPGWDQWQHPFWAEHPGERQGDVTWLECPDRAYAAWLMETLVVYNRLPQHAVTLHLSVYLDEEEAS